MATQEAERLTEWHRQQQAGISATTAILMLRLYAALDPADPEGTTQRWLELVIPALRRQRKLSAQLAAFYVRAIRRVELPDVPADEFVPEVLGEVDAAKLVTSMIVTGPVQIRKELRKREQEAIERAKKSADPDALDDIVPLQRRDLEQLAVKAARAAQRHALDGGRETLYRAVKDDPRALGYMRVSDGDPCYFCAMLVSRGPVYKEDSFEDSDPRFHGEGEHKVHDGCGCTIAPVYTSVRNPSDLERTLSDLWAGTGAKKSGSDAILAFRRAYEGRDKPAEQ